MAVRNFWVSGDIEGRKSELRGGPVQQDGGMDVTLYQRDEGSITTALTIVCRAQGPTLHTYVRDAEGNEVFHHVTER